VAMRPVEVRINGDTSGLDRALGRAGRGLRNMAIAGVAAAAAVTTALTAMTVQGLASVDALAKSARAADATANGLRAVHLAAADAGVSTSDATTALQQMNRELTRAAEEGTPAHKALGRLGLAAKDLQNLDADKRIALIADRVQTLGLSAGETSDIMRDLGVRSREMALLMIGGGDAIRAAREEVREFGLELTDNQIGAIEDANDAVSRMTLIFEGLRNKLASEVAPILLEVANRFNEFAQSEGAQEAIARIAEAFGNLIQIVGSDEFLSTAIAVFERLISITASLAQGLVYLSQNVELVAGAASVAAVALAAMGGPITLIVSATALAVGGLALLHNRSEDLAGSAQAAADASNNLTVAMGDEITQAQLLDGVLKTNGEISVEFAKVKLQEAQARYENVSAIIAEQRALALSGSEYTKLTTSIDTAQDALRGIGERTLRNAESFDNTEQFLAEQIERRQRLLDVDEKAAAQLAQTQENINSLTDRIANSVGGMITTGNGAVTPIIPGVDPATPDAPADTPTSAAGTGGGTGGLVGELETRLETLMTGLQTEREALTIWREEGLSLLEESLAAENLTTAEYLEARQRLEEEYARRSNQIESMRGNTNFATVTSGINDILGAAAQGNDKILRVQKIFAASMALVDTFQGAARMLRAGTFGFPAAAAVIAKGIGFVAAINSAGSGGSGGAGGGGASSAAVAAQAAPPQSQNVMIDLVGATGRQIDQFQAFADTFNEASRQGLMTNVTVRGI